MSRILRVSLTISLISACIGAGIGLVQAQEDALWSVLVGMVTGASIAMGCTLIEMALLSNTALRPVRRMPPLLLVGVRCALFSLVILVGISLPYALLGRGAAWEQSGFVAQFAMSCAIAALFSIGVEVVRFLGREASLSLISVRYAAPRLEDRVVMFADVTGSTRLGARLGALRFHRFLSEVAGDLAQPINAAGGQVHRYVGDAVIVTWPRAQGVKDGACLRCARGMHAALDRAAPRYVRLFGEAPRIRIALHVGEVAAGEMGDWKKEITLLGDVMNTTARIEAAAKQHGAATVLSDTLAEGLPADHRSALVQLPAGSAALIPLWRDGADDHAAG